MNIQLLASVWHFCQRTPVLLSEWHLYLGTARWYWSEQQVAVIRTNHSYITKTPGLTCLPAMEHKRGPARKRKAKDELDKSWLLTFLVKKSSHLVEGGSCELPVLLPSSQSEVLICILDSLTLTTDHLEMPEWNAWNTKQRNRGIWLIQKEKGWVRRDENRVN